MCSSMITQDHNQATTALPAACQEEGKQQGGASACCLTHSCSISCPKTVSMEEGNQQATALCPRPIRNSNGSSIKEEEEEEEAVKEADMLSTTTEHTDDGDLTNGTASSPSSTTKEEEEAVDMLSTISQQRDDGGDLVNGAASSPSSTAGERKTDLSVISSMELREHCKPGDAWISINGKVYDVSRWLSSHPGGAKLLLAMAGKDATDAFLAFHAPGTGSAILPGLLVATLSDYDVSPLSADYRQTLATLRQAGLFRRDLSPYLLLATVLLAMFCLSLAGVLLVRHGFLLHMASAAMLGLVWSQTSFVMHDYAHSPFLRNPSLNLWLQTFIANCLTGLSPSWWKKSHNAHHACTNDLSRDPDLQFIPFFAVSSSFFSSLYSHYHERRMSFNSAARLLVSYQHWTFYPVMLIARINLFLQAFVFFLSGDRMQSKAMEIGGIVCFWTWFLALLACLPDWKERLGFLLVSSATTSVQHLQFCLNHFSCEVEEGADGGGHDFLMSQFKGTLNIECPPWMDWFHGGLQFQLEHHLFPRLPRHNLRKVSGAVRALCEKHGLRYECVGFWEANRMLFRTLHAAAMEARKL